MYIPASFYTNSDSFEGAFRSEAIAFGIEPSVVDHIYQMVPASIKSSRAVKMIFDDCWRYHFGNAYKLENLHASSNLETPFFTSLIRAVLVAERVHAPKHWWVELSNPGKHLDALFEMLAMSNVLPAAQLVYEPDGFGVGPSRIDWQVISENENILVEVKNRPVQIVNELKRIQNARLHGANLISEPITDFEKLFASTYSKFPPISESAQIQGALIFLNIKVPADKFASFYFERLQKYFHFVALGKEDNQAGITVNILSSTPEIVPVICSALRWKNSADLLYS